MKHVEPVVAPLVSNICLGLCDFISVVGERVVDTAAVDIKVFAKVLHADTRAFDMPTGIADAPRRIPLKLLRIELGLCKPKHEVCLVSLVGVLLNALSNAYLKVFFLEIVENVVLLKL